MQTPSSKSPFGDLGRAIEPSRHDKRFPAATTIVADLPHDSLKDLIGAIYRHYLSRAHVCERVTPAERTLAMAVLGGFLTYEPIWIVVQQFGRAKRVPPELIHSIRQATRLACDEQEIVTCIIAEAERRQDKKVLRFLATANSHKRANR
jgi:hypothetical protein